MCVRGKPYYLLGCKIQACLRSHQTAEGLNQWTYLLRAHLHHHSVYSLFPQNIRQLTVPGPWSLCPLLLDVSRFPASGSQPSVFLCMFRQHLTPAASGHDAVADVPGLSLPLCMSFLINLLSASFLYDGAGKTVLLKDTAEEISQDPQPASPGFPFISEIDTSLKLKWFWHSFFF